ncbi:hypothetical protein BaRGS_00007426 [Batillaria attramentaria]|uniref:Uncharacterized protein n=1 Tax=Batillaria attramentaria TaxID=370345 RepID=A0ABD0LQ64_9CAEN
MGETERKKTALVTRCRDSAPRDYLSKMTRRRTGKTYGTGEGTSARLLTKLRRAKQLPKEWRKGRAPD